MVNAVANASTAAATYDARWRQSTQPPMPTSAPIAGASATV